MTKCKVVSDDGKTDWVCTYRFTRACDDFSTRPGVHWMMDGEEVVGCSNGQLRRVKDD
jgi:hypothetical protein